MLEQVIDSLSSTNSLGHKTERAKDYNRLIRRNIPLKIRLIIKTQNLGQWKVAGWRNTKEVNKSTWKTLTLINFGN